MGCRNRYDGIDPFAVRLIRKRARQLVGGAGFTPCDVPDLEQELAMDLLTRLPKFQEGRAPLESFIAVAVKHRAATLIEARMAAKRDFRKFAFSLEQDLTDKDGKKRDGYDRLDKEKILDSDGIRRGLPDQTEKMVRAIDLDRVLQKLSPGLRELCDLLSHLNVSEAAQATGLSRDTLYRRIKTLRETFESEGLREFIPKRSDTFQGAPVITK